ncbi:MULTISPECIES: hypothetical protein [Pseudomonas]|jgi:acetolactate synthase regulatory subunit|uniref:hypothetical protein n=1 Tax=Pseudomonas TaxID=286 RepID=UPI0006765EDF|nr:MULTISPECIES: hypothetical protein [Pseudomonas]KNC14699.1 hypothetical protein AC788_08590 [Pseudomonas sp. RIT-PI-a]KQQ57815.1 hypothetical protein ASF66_17015 [Pseudomonas sp. Leaf129]MBD8481172.1 hypothetical protein [Pseudomonas coleopterorum]MDY1017052.1 hypothetical protein [Pseudomonas coleopterorum]SEE71479.1 hypothetical protein SAMN05216510_3980 [Pseudomonas coleopterorum]
MSAFESLTPLRPDVWAAGNLTTTVQFNLSAEIEADVLCRVLNLFAMQYLIPCQLAARQVADSLEIQVQVSELSWHRAQVIAEKMRNLISVLDVQLADAQHPAQVQSYA